MASQFPAEVTFGHVTWRVAEAVQDTDQDADTLPDRVAVAGSVTLTPIALLKVSSATPLTVLPMPSVCPINPATGGIDVDVVATDSPSTTPVDWTYQATFNIPGVKIPGFSFRVPGGSTVDLTTALPAAVSNGTPVLQGPQGVSVADAAVQGGSLVFTLSNGQTTTPVTLPGGSTVTADSITGSGATGVSLLKSATSAAARTALGLGTAATAASTAFDAAGAATAAQAAAVQRQNHTGTQLAATISDGDGRWGAFYAATAANTRVNNVVNFGAKGDNVTDDTAAIQAAINAGGITYFPPGNYMVTNLTLAAGSLLRGENAGAPGIIPAAAQRSCLRRTDTAVGNFVTIPAGAGVGKLERLELDGRNRPGNGIHLADFAGGEEAQWKFDDVYVHDTAITPGAFADGDGIYVGNNRRAATFKNVQAYQCGRHGFNIQASDTKWIHCSAAANGWAGWVTNGGATRIMGGDNYGNGGAAAALASSTVAGVTNAGTSPTTVTTSAAHGLLTGMQVLISGAGGVSGQVNMVYPVTVTDATHFTIPTTNTGAWTSGGTVRPLAPGLWHRGGAGVVLTAFGCDRNQFMGILADLSCGNISINAILTSNGKQADGAWGNIEINSQNNAVALNSVLFQPQVGGQSQRPWYDVLTRNSSTWKESGIVQSGSTASGSYTNFTAGQRGQVFSNTANVASGYLQLDAAAHVALAQLTPGLPFDVESTDGGTTWTYGGVTVTSRPTARTDVRMQCVTNGTTLPAWAITGDRLLKVP